MSQQAGQRSGFAIYRRLLRHVLPFWKVFALAVLGMAIFAASDGGFAAVIKPMLDDSFIAQDPVAIKWVPLMIIGIFFLRVVAGFLSGFGMAWVARHVIRDLRGKMFRQMLTLPVSYYDTASSGTLIAKVLYDVEQLASASSNVITILIRDSLSILVLLGLMAWMSLWLTLVFVVLTPVVVVLILLVSRRFRKLARRIQNSMGNVSDITEEVIGGNRVIKIFGGQAYEEGKFAEINQYNLRQQLKFAAVNAFSTPFVQLLVACAFAVIVYLATVPGVREAITPGTFGSFIAAMVLLTQPVRRLTAINANLQQGIAAAISVFDFIDQPQERDTGSETMGRARGEVRFENVTFTYDTVKGNVLEDIDLEIAPGETVAFVGKSGTGKSTLVSLLPRFYEIPVGRITLDGRDIRNLTLQSLRQQVALVSQQVTLFNDTIAHNIAYGALEETTREDVERAARAAHAMEFIERLPEGLETIVGENGVMLSGGQRQRVAIARALLKDAPILILDEATSALDTESERHIQAALETLISNRTTLVIAHRLSTIESADKIVVLDRGRIVEAGRHDELLARGGTYAGLHQLQFSGEAVN
ncbi:MAG: lipid A export permease/ATP-binding protein MsbA [Pseudomonadota bacterium]|nr:MAG: lipid A export permease/ATP-binding protein MsbA [Pseudomonadota bacterium]